MTVDPYIRAWNIVADNGPLGVEIPVLDHGYVALTDVMGDDRTPARTARTSFRNHKNRTPEEDAKLTDYLMRNEHSTPFEFCTVRYYIKAPIFVARQFVRHRNQSINEISYRYVKAAREFYIPTRDRMQRKAESNKQGSSSEIVDHPDLCETIMRRAGEEAFDYYDRLLVQGLAPELARTVLPVSTYTEWYTQMSLRNFLHMIRLRRDPHAQYETRAYAVEMLALAERVYPTIVASWVRSNAIS